MVKKRGREEKKETKREREREKEREKERERERENVLLLSLFTGQFRIFTVVEQFPDGLVVHMSTIVANWSLFSENLEPSSANMRKHVKLFVHSIRMPTIKLADLTEENGIYTNELLLPEVRNFNLSSVEYINIRNHTREFLVFEVNLVGTAFTVFLYIN